MLPTIEIVVEESVEFEFQYNFIKSGEADVILEMLTKNKFLPNADETTKRSAYLIVLKLCKLLLTVIGNVMICMMEEYHTQQENHDGHAQNNRVLIKALKQTMFSVPNHYTKFMATKLAQQLANHILSGGAESDRCRALFMLALSWELPDINTIRAIIKLAWAASTGNLDNVNASAEVLHSIHEVNQKEQKCPDNNDVLGEKEYFKLYIDY